MNGRSDNFKKPLEKTTIQFLVLLGIALVVALCLMPFVFFNHLDVVLGWILGSAIELICFFTIIKFSSFLVRVSKGGNPATAALSVASYFIRILLYAGGLILGALCTFKANEWMGGFNYFNFWAIFASYMPMPVVLLITGAIFNKKTPKKFRDDELGDGTL